MFILFACSQVIFIFSKFGFDSVEQNGVALDMTFDLASMIFPVLFIWVAGTLPLQEFRVAKNIAGPSDA